ncbi:MAG: 1-acyl-sn-glycerol-3-phosphate acyltransferase [Desulfarculaceae bacterium]|nr:1-acyl-sn-glycerol-3-phosphate acyltransferase [Desulfarculaceae bacterium]
MRYVWSAWAILWLLILTIPLCSLVLIGYGLGVNEHKLQWAARWWARLLMGGIGCRVRIRGLENLEAGATYVFAGNHASSLDIPGLQAVLPKNFRWVAKKELFDIPLFGAALKAVGDIPLDRSAGRQALQSLIEAARRVSRDTSVVIFPEGTRSRDGELLPFKSGGFLLAIKSGRPVVPFFLKGTHEALVDDSLLLDPGPIEVILGTPIPAEGMRAEAREEMAALVRERILALKRGEEAAPVDSPGSAA